MSLLRTITSFWSIQAPNAPNKENKEPKFAQMWNKIISSFREEDLINNRLGYPVMQLKCFSLGCLAPEYVILLY